MVGQGLAGSEVVNCRLEMPTMIARAILWALLLAAPMTAFGQDDPRAPVSFGIGIHSCANWTDDPAKQQEGQAWILGYWSGLNIQNRGIRNVGHATDGRGVLGEVRRVCLLEPSNELENVIVDVWVAMAKAGR